MTNFFTKNNLKKQKKTKTLLILNILYNFKKILQLPILFNGVKRTV